MNESSSRLRPRRVCQIADDVCELVQQQMDVLQQGLAEGELDQYLERRKQIHELQVELKALLPGPS